MKVKINIFVEFKIFSISKNIDWTSKTDFKD